MGASILAFGIIASHVFAFPALAATGLTQQQTKQLKTLGQQAAQMLQHPPKLLTPLTFDPASQLVDVTGIHEFQPRGPTDQRGPCPGLNALANHGFLPRSGYALVSDYILAPSDVYGMDIDLATILGAYGGIFNGDVVSWGIGGTPHNGIAGSHNNYEGDSSPTRGDLNQDGTNTDVIIANFQHLLDMHDDPDTANYDLETLIDFRITRYNDSLNGNPYFYLGPFTGFVGGAAHVLIPNMFSNHSDKYPNGFLSKDVLMSFFAISTVDNGSLVYTPGHERIPDNWYRRSQSDPYDFASIANDVSTINTKYPQTAQIGCNQGTVNSFVPIDQFNTSLSVYDFSKPTDNVCYAMALVGTVTDSVPLVSLVLPHLILPIQNALDCPTVPSIDKSVGDACPGYSFYGGPTGPIAPGAVPVTA